MMLQAITDAVQGTPTWVYILFVYLIVIGIKSSKGDYVSLVKLSILPILFTYMSVYNLINELPHTVLNVLIWLFTLAIGTFFGVWRLKKTGASYDIKRGEMYMDGSWMTLIVVMVIFISKYSFAYATNVHPDLFKKMWFDILYLCVSGICTGQFVGVLLQALRIRRDTLKKSEA